MWAHPPSGGGMPLSSLMTSSPPPKACGLVLAQHQVPLSTSRQVLAIDLALDHGKMCTSYCLFAEIRLNTL